MHFVCAVYTNNRRSCKMKTAEDSRTIVFIIYWSYTTQQMLKTVLISFLTTSLYTDIDCRNID